MRPAAILQSVFGSMVDLPTLGLVVDAVKSTLTSFMLDLRADDNEVHEYDMNVNRMRSLSQSLGGVEKLEELDMRVKVPMPVAVYVNLIQGFHSLRKCSLDFDSPSIALAVGESETESWRTFPQSRTPWHQLTTLTISNTNLSLTLGAIILTSGTIRHLHIDGSDVTLVEETSSAAFQEFLSAMEAHCNSLTSLSCTFRGCDGDSEIPTLDHVLPFLTSCTNLTNGAADLKTIAPLLSLTKLESLTIQEVFLDGPSDSGLRIGHLLKFLRQHKGVLKYFEVDYMEHDDERSRERRTLNRLIEEAAGRNIEFLADLVD